MDKNIIQGVGPAIEQTLGISDYEVAVNAFSVKLSAYIDNGAYFMTPDVNNSGASTLSIEGLAPISISRNGGGALQANDLVAGMTYMLIYNAASSRFEAITLDFPTWAQTLAAGPTSGGNHPNLLDDDEIRLGTGLDGTLRYKSASNTVEMFTVDGTDIIITAGAAIGRLFLGSNELVDLASSNITIGAGAANFVRIGASAVVSTKLTVQSDATNTYAAQFISSASAPIIAAREDGLVGIGTITPNAILNVVDDGVEANVLNIESSTLADLFTVQRGGGVNLGWAGASTDFNLYIRNISNTFGTSAYIWNGGTTGTDYGMQLFATGAGGTLHVGLAIGATGATTNLAISSTQGDFQFSGANQRLSLGVALSTTATAIIRQINTDLPAVDKALHTVTQKATGTNYSLFAEAKVTSTGTNIAGYFDATGGATNYGLLVANGSVGIGTTTPDASALLEMVSTTQGLLLPRMTTVQRSAITLPAKGLLLYNTTTDQWEGNNGTPAVPNWVIIG